MFSVIGTKLLTRSYGDVFGSPAGGTGRWTPLDNLLTAISKAGWLLTFRVGVYAALVEVVMIAWMIVLNGSRPADRAQAKQRITILVITTLVLVNLVAITAYVEKALGLDFNTGG